MILLEKANLLKILTGGMTIHLVQCLIPAMVIKIGALYGKTLDVASVKETFATLGAGFAARTLFQGIISLLPVAKNFLGPPYAAAATHGIGVAAKAYFKGGRATPEQIEKEIKEELKRRES